MPPAEQPACLFFARVKDAALLDVVEFYREDIEALRALGYAVRVSTRNRDVVGRLRRPDVAYCWWHHSSLATIVWMRLLRVPVVVTGALHAHDEAAGGARDSLRLFLSHLGARLASMNVAISEIELRGLRFVRPARALEIPLAADTDYFTPPAEPVVGPPAAVTVGQLNPSSIRRKGIDLAIEAVPRIVASIPDFHLHVVGLASAEGEAIVRRLVAESDPEHITVHGGVTRDRKLELLRSARVYLQPSAVEGFGLSALEALACGVPVIHSGRGSLPEVVGKAGVTVVERTSAALADAVIAYLSVAPSEPPLDRLAREQAESLSRTVRIARLGVVLDRVRMSNGAQASQVWSSVVRRGVPGSMVARARAARDRALGHAGIADGSRRVLNVGCGVDLMPNADNVDMVATAPGVRVVDLDAFPWPLPSEHYDYVVAINVMEHLSSPVRVIEEIHRVLRPGGVAVLRTPYWNSPDQLADLTHRHHFGHRSFDMFDPDTELGRQRAYYSTSRFSIVRYILFLRPFGVYVPVTGPRFVMSALLRLGERVGRVVWSQEHWLRKRA